MPEHSYKISVVRKIDLSSQSARKALEGLQKALRSYEEHLGRRGAEGGPPPLPKNDAKNIVAMLEGVARAFKSAGEAAEGLIAHFRDFGEREDISDAIQRLKKKVADLPAHFAIIGKEMEEFADASERSINRFFSDVLAGRVSNAKALFRDFKNHAVAMVRDAASEMASKQFVEPAVDIIRGLGTNLLGTLGKGLLNVFGFAKGGLVKKPTLGVLGEAGPELVVPLARIGGEAGIARLFRSVAEIEAANRIGGTAVPTAAGAAGAERLASNIALARAAASLQIVSSAAEFLSGPKTLRTGARLGLTIAGALPGLTGATGLAAVGPAAGAFVIGDILLGKGQVIRKGLAAVGLKGLVNRSTPYSRAIGALSQAAGIYQARARFRDTGVARDARNLPLPGAVYRGAQAVDGILLEKVGPQFQLIRQAAQIAGVSAKEGVRRYFGEELHAAWLRALPVQEGDAAGRFVTRSALRLVGEAGPEHIMNVNHPRSIDFFQRGVRPIIEGAIREELSAAGAGGDVYHIHIEGNLSDDRTLDALARRLEEIGRNRRRYGGA